MRKENFDAKYYQIVNVDNSKPYLYYNLEIDWKVENIIDTDCKDGYIVQKVKIINTTDIKDIKNIEYYEAWEVINGNCVGHKDSEYDDKFFWIGYDMIYYIIAKSIGKNGKIEYQSEVYWISKQNKLYEIVNKWRSQEVLEARKLKSILVENCPEFASCNPIFKRDNFVHKVIFDDKELIKETIENIVMALKTNHKDILILSLKEELIEISTNPENAKYISILNEIISKL